MPGDCGWGQMTPGGVEGLTSAVSRLGWVRM